MDLCVPTSGVRTIRKEGILTGRTTLVRGSHYTGAFLHHLTGLYSALPPCPIAALLRRRAAPDPQNCKYPRPRPAVPPFVTRQEQQEENDKRAIDQPTYTFGQVCNELKVNPLVEVTPIHVAA